MKKMLGVLVLAVLPLCVQADGPCPNCQRLVNSSLLWRSGNQPFHVTIKQPSGNDINLHFSRQGLLEEAYVVTKKQPAQSEQ